MAKDRYKALAVRRPCGSALSSRSQLPEQETDPRICAAPPTLHKRIQPTPLCRVRWPSLQRVKRLYDKSVSKLLSCHRHRCPSSTVRAAGRAASFCGGVLLERAVSLVTVAPPPLRPFSCQEWVTTCPSHSVSIAMGPTVLVSLSLL